MNKNNSASLCQRYMAVQHVPVAIEPVTTEDGSAWRNTTLELGVSRRYFYFDIQEPLLKNENAQDVIITLTYLDQFEIPLFLQYDSIDEKDGGWKTVDGVRTGNSSEWKTFSWRLEDAAFKSRCKGHDFRIAIDGDVDFVIADCAVSGIPRQTTILPDIFSSHMVLQRDVPLRVWGLAADGTCVTVAFNGNERKSTSEAGKWEVILPPMPVSCEPLNMEISADDGFEAELTDILIGDVFLASGQSNMDMQLRDVQDGPEAVAASANPLLRLFTVSKVLENTVPPLGSSWVAAAPGSVSGICAVGYFFCKEIQQTQGIPVGLINCSYGGTVTETWCSPATLAQGWPGWESWQKEWLQGPDWTLRNTSSYLYERMLKSVMPFPLKGFLWYQGESNAERAEEQKKLFPAMVRDWRKSWGDENLPFYFVQIARFDESDWHEFRCAQLDIWKNTPRTYMAVTIDLSKDWNLDDHPIHPKTKAPIAYRLALAARANIYSEEDLVYSGPVIKEICVSEGKSELSFEHIGSGLASSDGKPLRGFYISADGERYVPAEAEIAGDRVIVSSPDVPDPIAVRYGAEADMGKEKLDVNLVNSEKLPASPFTLFV